MRKRKLLAIALSVALMLTMLFAQGTSAVSAKTQNATADGNVGISVAEFEKPSMQYRPGVRWWWPGGAIEEDELIREIKWLADNGIGVVEINPFDVPAETDPVAQAKIADIYTESFYDLLDVAITEAEKYGIIVDLNMGPGWNASSQYVTYDDSMGSMALGRITVSGSVLLASAAAITAPEPDKSIFYYPEGSNSNYAVWDGSKVLLEGVLIGEHTGALGTSLTRANKFTTPNGTATSKSYANQIQLDVDKSYYFDRDELTGNQIALSPSIQSAIDPVKDYEIAALYYLPSGGTGIHCAPAWYVVDHMDAEKVTQYINDWIGDAQLKVIVQNHDNIRALFNDSYEFYSDMFYTDAMYELAKDSSQNGLGYDFSKYLPTLYRSLAATPHFRNLGTNDTFLTFTLDANEKARLTYDYNTLVNQKFEEGMSAFQSTSNKYGLQYRQQAYNPPIDTIGAAKYVDIPETEQASELTLIRTASGGHLYGRNLVTAEQYTLGSRPFTNSLEQVKVGFDIMATSGVNNFFYHGYNYMYGRGTAIFGENGWSGFPTIGINMTENNTLAPYFNQLSTYAARANYLMQSGKPSKDVAVYMPFNGSLTNTEAIQTLNMEGYAWDAINDDSILSSDTVYQNGKISVNGGNMAFDAIVVDSATVGSNGLPVGTMEKLKGLAASGATIIFHGATLPAKQPGYADGDYPQEDQKVAAAAAKIVAEPSSYHTKSATILRSTLRSKVSPAVTYDSNENVRFSRRSLSNGGEIAFIRNIGNMENTITIRPSNEYKNFYWLDQNTGKIYEAEQKEGVISLKLKAGNDVLSNSRSMSIVLLCEPANVAIPDQLLTNGTPTAMDFAVPESTEDITPTSLKVTADNIDGMRGGSLDTVTYTNQVLGKWNDAGFNGGALQKVVADGVYDINYTRTQSLTGKKVILDLGEVYTAARVKVNGITVGDVLYTPYRIDITSALKEGDNRIEVTVTPRKMNRYYQDADWSYSATSLQDAGWVGPANLLTLPSDTAPEVITPPVITPPVMTPEVTPTAVSLASAEVAVSAIANRQYTGKQIKPAVTVTVSGKSLSAATDYTISYGANKAIGKATVKIDGKGNYSGTRTVTFKIVPKKTSLKNIIANKKQIKLTWKKVSAAQKVTQYQIQYRAKGIAKWKTKTVSAKKASLTIKKLQKGKKYQVRIRAYKTVSGVKYYAPWSKAKTSGKVK